MKTINGTNDDYFYRLVLLKSWALLSAASIFNALISAFSCLSTVIFYLKSGWLTRLTQQNPEIKVFHLLGMLTKH
jgi:hypothetical protein